MEKHLIQSSIEFQRHVNKIALLAMASGFLLGILFGAMLVVALK